MYPEAKSVGRWLAHGWHVTVAYIIGFFVMLATVGWQPHEPHKAKRTSLTVPSVVAFAAHDEVS
jgi:hypothetical protein